MTQHKRVSHHGNSTDGIQYPWMGSKHLNFEIHGEHITGEHQHRGLFMAANTVMGIVKVTDNVQRQVAEAPEIVIDDAV